ncbi:hypothetical protein [Streptomyces sp. NPDC096934]|uniref:effector-associated constant component EACC1 n=1 Tax=Streptomyces sp. NPDC096934 TaxID=3155551 RepID=UPI003326CE63
MMRISMVGRGADEELRSLRFWLLESPEVRHHAKISWETSEPHPGAMGTDPLPVLALVTDNLWQIATFSMSYIAWRKTRRRTPVVTIEQNGKSVTIEGDDTEAVERIIRALSEE